MAITIRQEPTSPNMANSNLVYIVTSGLTGNAQYQYVLDIYESGSTDLIQRIKQQPNPGNKGIFDIGQIITSQLESDNVWKAAPFTILGKSNKDFVVKFGEEYGTSTSSSVTLYDGAGSPGDPSVTGLDFYTITDGLVEPNSGDWNFASASYYTSSVTPTGGSGNFTRSSALTNASLTQSIQDGEYETISLYNGNFDLSSTNAQDAYYVQVRVYNSAGSNIQNFGFFNTTANSGGPRTSEAQEWSAVYTDQTNRTRLLHIGVGPQNFEDAGNTLNSSWAYYIVDVVGQEGAGVDDSTAIYASYKFTKDTANCAYDGVRFAWKNEFGVWDYYTFKLAESTISNITRQEYKQSFVDFSKVTITLPYDIERRGRSQYYNNIVKRKTANTDFLNQADADFLRELFFSTNVYVQEGTDFIPVVITSANVVEKTNDRAQKLFRYEVEYNLANGERPRK